MMRAMAGAAAMAVAVMAVAFGSVRADTVTSVSESGAWCWFSEPRAVYANGRIFTGWVSRQGDIVAASITPDTGETESSVLYPKLEVDDHDNPAFAVLPDGRIAAFYGKHGKDALYVNVSARPHDVTAWSTPRELRLNNPELTREFGHDRYTYANPWVLRSEQNRIYLFWRGAGYKPNVSWSDDLGETWTPSRIVISPQPFDSRQRPYAKYYSTGADRIHMIFTDGHPRNEPHNSVYYACYREGAFWRADGSRICGMDELPFEPKDASVVYDASESGARAWVWDVCEDDKGLPVAVYATCPEEPVHRYYYARFDGKEWSNRLICDAGKWFPQTPPGQTEREPHYSAGLSLDPANPDRVVLARSVDGKFEIEAWTTPDRGVRWEHTAITAGSAHDNVRPYVPRNMPVEGTAVLWMQNRRYVHYTDFDSSILLYR